ncbi:MAG: DnaJ domain-containing protein [Sphingobacteriales bacterium]|nr:DnaJ domain-containing protein [Sphingobacteriales bacterium]
MKRFQKRRGQTAYKTLAQIYHPDKNPENIIESEEKMKKIKRSKRLLGCD